MSSFLIAAPPSLVAAAADFTSIASATNEANTAAAAFTTGVVPAAADEVSTAIAGLFGTYARDYQSLSARAALFHEEFVGALSSSAGAYAAGEAAPTRRPCRRWNTICWASSTRPRMRYWVGR
jgi:PE family